MTSQQSDSFAPLWQIHQYRIRGYLYAAVQDFHICDDLLQKVALAAIDKFDQYDPERPFVAYALGLARIEIMRHRQQQHNSKITFSDPTLLMLEQAFEEPSDPRLDSLAECLKHINGKAKQALYYVYNQSYGGQQAADALKISLSHLHVLLHRTRATLRQCIESKSTTNIPSCK